MKKVLAFALALTLILSIGALAFADSSPTGGGSSANVPVDITEVVYGPATTTTIATPTVITRAVAKDGTETVTLTAEQEKQVDTAIDNAIKSGNAVVEAIIVEVPDGASDVKVIVEIKDNEKLLMYSLDGSLQQTLFREDLVHVEGDFYEVTIPESCIIVIAKQ